jgi:hypothetical protein
MNTKAKASASVYKPNTLALALNFGGLAERLNATDCKSVNGASNTVQGFKSLTRRQIAPPVKALTSTRGMNRTAEAARIRKFSIRLLAVELKGRFHSDLPYLPDRM